MTDEAYKKYHITRFYIKGFRRLCDVHLEIRPFMVMIGANGVGKTSILDAFSLLSASAGGTLNQKLGRWADSPAF